MHYRHLLLAVDNGPDSNALLTKAAESATAFKARLSLLSVLPPAVLGAAMPPDLGVPLATVGPEGLQWSAEQQELTRMDLVSRAAPFGVSAGDVHVIVGSTPGAITDTAQEIAVDLIVVGHHPQSWFAGLFGSTDQSVLGKAHCDVLAVHLPKVTS